MGVYAVRGLDGDDEGSLRKVLDSELKAAAPERGNLLRKMRGQNLNTVRDITLWDMMDADDLYGMMVSEYGCSMTRRAFLRKLASLDRDGTGRIRASELHAWLKEMVVSWAAETEGLSLNEARSTLQAVIDRGLSHTGETTLGTKTSSKGDNNARRDGRHYPALHHALVSRYLPTETEEQVGASQVSAPRVVEEGQSRRGVQLLYSSAPSPSLSSGEQGPGARHKQAPCVSRSSPYNSDHSKSTSATRGTFWERFQLQPEVGGGKGRSRQRSARIMSGVYNYGPRGDTSSNNCSGVLRRPRSVPNPPVLVQSLEQRRIEVLNAELSEGRPKEDQGPMHLVSPAPGCVASQTYLTARNHSQHRPASTSAVTRPKTSPTSSAGTPLISSPKHQQRQSPTARPGTSLSPAGVGVDGNNNKKWWEVGGHFAEEETGSMGEQRQPPSSPPRAQPENIPLKLQVREPRAQTAPGTVTMARARPMSRYKYRQAESFLTREYRPSKGEVRLGWTPPNAGSTSMKGTRGMMANIKLKERPTASALSMRLDAFHQVRQAEARRQYGVVSSG